MLEALKKAAAPGVPEECWMFFTRLLTKKKNRDFLNIKKTVRQISMFSKWSRKAKGTMEAVTGFGKTMIGIIAIAVMNIRKPGRVTHVVVPTQYLKDQWEAKVTQFNLTDVEVYVINTYITSPRACGLLIADEIHNYAAPTFQKLFSVCNYAFILGLTATIERKDGKHELLQKFAPIIDRVTLAEARRDGYISDFIVYNLGIELSEDDRKEYNKLHSTFNRMFARFGHDFNLAMACSAGKNKGGPKRCAALAYKMGWKVTDGDSHFWSPSNISSYAQQWSWAMRARKDFLHHASSKIDVTKQILNKFKVKAITFSESTRFADELAEEMGKECMAYHSSLETIIVGGKKKGATRRKKEALSKFNDGRSPVRILSTARALDEGFDVEDIELAIVASATSVKRQNIQRIGRAVRFKPDKTAIIVNLYIKDSQDAKWLKKRTATTINMVNIDDVNQIKTDRAEVEFSNAAPKKSRAVFRLSR